MFFKMSRYINKNYDYTNQGSTQSNDLSKLNQGQYTVYINTDEIKKIGITENNYQYFIDFKSPPFPFLSQTFFVFDTGSIEHNTIKEMLNYIDGTERF
jgi:hypothetical protein